MIVQVLLLFTVVATKLATGNWANSLLDHDRKWHSILGTPFSYSSILWCYWLFFVTLSRFNFFYSCFIHRSLASVCVPPANIFFCLANVLERWLYSRAFFERFNVIRVTFRAKLSLKTWLSSSLVFGSVSCPICFDSSTFFLSVHSILYFASFSNKFLMISLSKWFIVNTKSESNIPTKDRVNWNSIHLIFKLNCSAIGHSLSLSLFSLGTL